MATLALLTLSVLIFLMLLHLNGLLALLFFLAAIIAVPAVIIQRRETAIAPDLRGNNDTESPLRGVLRLAQIVGSDATGVALGVLWLIFVAVLTVFLSRHAFHVH